MEKNQWISLLKQDVVPALGCTEPVCVALCAAYASRELTGAVNSITVRTNAGIYKNGMSAGIPNCDRVGLPWAAAIGCCLADPRKQLQMLEDITPEILARAAALVQGGKVSVSVAPEESGLFVSCTLRAGEETATAVIRSAHTNLVYLQKNDTVLLDAASSVGGTAGTDPVDILKEMTVAQIRAMVDTASAEELDFLMDGVDMNEALAAYSETTPTGVGIPMPYGENWALRCSPTTCSAGS